MASEANPDAPMRANVGLPLIAVAFVAVIALVGFLGYQLLTPKEYLPPLPKNAATPDPSVAAFQTWAKQRYKETGGDWNKLPQEEQQRFTNAAHGKGKSMFESYKP